MHYKLFCIFLLFLCACTEYQNNTPKIKGEKYMGVLLSNSQRYGRVFRDSANNIYHYRYINTTIENDTTVPIYISLNFNNVLYSPVNSNKESFTAFLLPENFLPEYQQNIDTFMTKVIPFLRQKNKKHQHILKTLQPKQKFNINTGMLVDTIHRIDIIPSVFTKGHQLHIYPYPDDFITIPKDTITYYSKNINPLKLNLGISFLSSNDSLKKYSVIPFGEIQFK